MKKGFTLIELVVVIVIISILATFIGVSYTTSLRRGRDARRKADLRLIKSALESYRQDHGHYPVTLEWETSPRSTNWIPVGTGENFADYINPLPVDPENREVGAGGPTTRGNFLYGYYSVDNGIPAQQEGDCTGLKAGEYYILATHLENPQDTDSRSITLSTKLPSSPCTWPRATPPPDDQSVYAVNNE